MEPLPLHFFSEASHGRLVNDLGDIEIERVVTDSRTTRPGDLFVALRGDRFDAHDFISEAIDGGASAVLCSESNSQPSTKPSDSLGPRHPHRPRPNSSSLSCSTLGPDGLYRWI